MHPDKKTLVDLCHGTGIVDGRKCPGCDECLFIGANGMTLQVGGRCPDCIGSGDMHDNQLTTKETCWACGGWGEIRQREFREDE